ncbi:MAG: (Fe-S)-binding protein [Thermodesulfobacteriota bacterium]|nr:(Fe-S)-binding protein [Thermodesulfobacteriota bacterium]
MANKDYSIKELVELEACTNCRLCADVCPAASAALDGRLTGVYRISGIKKILRKRTGILQRLFGKKDSATVRLENFSETVFHCTLCGNCQEVCPVGIQLKDLWLSMRQDMVHSSAYPKKIDMIKNNLAKSRNVFDEDNEERADWVDDIRDAPDHGFIKDSAEVVYFTGCVSSFFPMVQKIPMALAETLEVSGVDFTLLGEEEWCCGFPLLGAGLRDKAGEFIKHNIKAVRQKGAKKIIFACPSCYQMWREYYPDEFEIFHVTEFLIELIKNKQLQLKELPMTVTYHDPCDLGRGARIFEAPRDIIHSIPGVNLVELSDNRENCRCCGGGGNLEMIDTKLSAEIAKRKIDDVMMTGAEAVITSCQQCVRTMNTYVRRNKIPLEVMDITELVKRALKTL